MTLGSECQQPGDCCRTNPVFWDDAHFFGALTKSEIKVRRSLSQELFNRLIYLFCLSSALLSLNFRFRSSSDMYIYIYRTIWVPLLRWPQLINTYAHSLFLCIYIDIDIGNLALLSNSNFNSDNIYMFFLPKLQYIVCVFCPNMCTLTRRSPE